MELLSDECAVEIGHWLPPGILDYFDHSIFKFEGQDAFQLVRNG